MLNTDLLKEATIVPKKTTWMKVSEFTFHLIISFIIPSEVIERFQELQSMVSNVSEQFSQGADELRSSIASVDDAIIRAADRMRTPTSSENLRVVDYKSSDEA